MTSLASLLGDLVPQLVATALDVVERDARLQARVRALVAQPEGAGGPAFLSRGHYAEHADVAPRTVDKLLARGLPCIGAGKLRRIPVTQADAWLAAHLGDEGGALDVTDEDEEIRRCAEANARRGAA